MNERLQPDALLPPWSPSVPEVLSQVGRDYLSSALGLAEADYSTARVIAGKSSFSAAIGHIQCEGKEDLVCEALPPDVARHFEDIGVFPAEESRNDQRLRTIREAILKTRTYTPCIYDSVTTLARRLHLIQSAGDDYDTSFSDPMIPFSIFFSVPLAGKAAILRTTESIVHEVCHLQLSLYERTTPLFIDSSGWTLYSPWKAAERETPGIVHGIYVFKVLEWMWRQVCSLSSDEGECAFASKRTREIAGEVLSVARVSESPDLTQEGREFVGGLLATD